MVQNKSLRALIKSAPLKTIWQQVGILKQRQASSTASHQKIKYVFEYFSVLQQRCCSDQLVMSVILLTNCKGD